MKRLALVAFLISVVTLALVASGCKAPSKEDVCPFGGSGEESQPPRESWERQADWMSDATPRPFTLYHDGYRGVGAPSFEMDMLNNRMDMLNNRTVAAAVLVPDASTGPILLENIKILFGDLHSSGVRRLARVGIWKGPRVDGDEYLRYENYRLMIELDVTLVSQAHDFNTIDLGGVAVVIENESVMVKVTFLSGENREATIATSSPGLHPLRSFLSGRAGNFGDWIIRAEFAPLEARAQTGCVERTWYADQDMDGYGVPLVTTVACTAPRGFVENRYDCNDRDFRINPSAAEVRDGKDNDCDSQVDETN